MGLFDNNNFLLLEWSYLLPMESEENGGTLRYLFDRILPRYLKGLMRCIYGSD